MSESFDTIIIGGGATNRGVETSVREAFNFDLASVGYEQSEYFLSGTATAYSMRWTW